MTNIRRQLRTAVVLFSATLAFAPSVDLTIAQTVTQLTNVLTSAPGPGALDDAGTVVFAGSSPNQLGGAADHSFEIIDWDEISGAAAPRAASSGDCASP